jgi:hypothetical protein
MYLGAILVAKTHLENYGIRDITKVIITKFFETFYYYLVYFIIDFCEK